MGYHGVMKEQVSLAGKSLTVSLSPAAEKALNGRHTPLFVEMELYFSCLIRKQVRFYEQAADHFQTAGETVFHDKLRVFFRPVMTRACGKDYEGDEPPLTDFPLAKVEAYTPRWLTLHFEGGQWQGEFGYQASR
jgi:hypothetical protein